MTFTKILCATDFSPGARQAQRAAVRLAREAQADLVLVHASYIPSLAYSLEAPFPPDIVQRFVDDSQRALDEAVKQAVADGAPRVTAKLVTGLPWKQIADELARDAYDVCVIGTHGRTGIARIWLGSVAEMVVRHAPCSVLTVGPDAEIEAFHHALVPSDFSTSAMHALDLATTLVAPTGSITILHAVDVPVMYGGEPPVGEFVRALDKTGTVALDRELARIRGTTQLAVRGQLRRGRPGAETLAVLDDDRSIDLVVMGSHGRTGIERALMGSVAEKVVRHARCPVLVARERPST